MKNYHPFVKLFSIAILTFCSKVMLLAQPGDCTIDAGLPGYWCPGDTIYLSGSTSGPIQPGSVQWTQIGGSPVLIQNANNLQASVFTNTAGTYIFTVSIGCNSGTAIDTVWQTLNPSVNIMDAAVTICPGESVPLQATGAFIYSWSPTSGLVNPDSANPVATPLLSTDYIVTGMSESGNLIYNGDFELGNTGFTSSYTYNASNIGPQAVYGITTDVQLLLGLAAPCHDHTTGSGNLMAANGAGVLNTTVWEQAVQVIPQTDYIFSAWVINWSPLTSNLSNLQFSINGQSLGAVFQPLPGPCDWKQFYITWNSGSNSSAVIRLVNQNLTVGGNDFGLDDIHFSRICTTTDTVSVIVEQPVTITQNISICPGDSFQVGSSTYTSPGTYTDILQTINGCDSTVITNLTVNNVTVSITSSPSIICSGDSVLLMATGAQYYSWSPATGLSDSTISNPVATPLQTTDYVVTGFSETENLIFNGDFELGNTGFTSSYTYNASDIGPQSVYGITTDVQLLLGLAAPCHDHTTGSGNLMAANGAGVLNTTVWEQTVQVIPQTDYIFSAWVINWSPLTSNLSNLQFSINGQSLGAVFQPLPGPCDWKQFYITWNSGSMSSAVIRLVNQNLSVGGNDFGLDDIHFSRICTTTDTVSVIVEQPITITQNISICPGDSFQVGSSTYTSPGTYTDILQTINGCDSMVITNLTVNNVSVSITSSPSIICSGDSVLLMATGAQYYSWSPATGLSDSTISNPVATPLQTIDYVVTCFSETENLIFNGDFEMGNIGFTSSYTYSATDIGPQSVYGITTDVQLLLGLAEPCHDHTTGSSNLMAVNGSGVPNTVVWEQTVPVVPNNDYIFSAWVTNWSSIQTNLSNLQFNINGVNLGPVFSPAALQCIWTQFYISWNSGTATSAVIQLINQNLLVGGNDFGIDDIQFSRICTSTDSVSVIVEQPIMITQDVSICAGQSLQVGTSSYTTPGTYADILQSFNGCDSIVITNLSVNAAITSVIASPSVICSGQNSILTASGGGTYSWSDGQSGAVINVSPSSTTTYSVTVTNGGCTATGSTTLVVNSANASVIASPSLICEGQNAVLTASGGGTYSWSNGQTGATINVTPLTTTTYTVTVSNNGCSESAETSVIVNSVTASIEALPPVICTGQNSILTATGGGLYSWSNGESGDAVNVSPLTTTTYTVTVTNNGCSETAQTTVAVDSVNATVVLTPIDCHGNQNAMIMASIVNGGTPPYQFSLNGSAYDQIGSYTNLPPGGYQLTVQDVNGCEWSTNLEIIDPPLLTLDLGQDTVISYGAIIQIEAIIEPIGSIDTLVWQDPEDLIFLNTLFDPSVQPFITSTYSATVIDTNGCTATDAITVYVEKQRNVFAPNIINPESAFPENSFFTIFGDQAVAQINILRIYDRWGELIFEKANFMPNDPVANGWDGTFRGLALDSQVFVWYAEVAFSDGSLEIYKGDISIVK